MSEQWEGQTAMGERLVREATGNTPVVVLPADDRVMLFPVVPDEERPVDLTVIQLGGQDLPEMGVVVGVGFDVNAEALHAIYRLECGENIPGGVGEVTAEAIVQAKMISVGDIVCINKFSGMDVPGTNFLLCSRRDVLCKLVNFPVKLRTAEERWDEINRAREEHEAEERAAGIATPTRKIIPATG